MAQISSANQPILEAATEAFLTHGFDGVTISNVAKAAGLARRTVFNRFATKEALFLAAVEHIWAAMPIEEIAAPQTAAQARRHWAHAQAREVAQPRAQLLRSELVPEIRTDG